jgi:hypothetical protein
VSELLTPERGVLDISGKFLASCLSLPLAEISTADLLVASALFDGEFELLAPHRKLLVGDLGREFIYF